MYLLENVQLALEGLMANKMRALLTMLGIIIGIGSVIAIVTVGDSMTATVSSSMSSLGATNMMLMLQEKNTRTMEMGFSETPKITESDLITDEMIEKYEQLYADKINAVSLTASVGYSKITEGRLYANVTIAGVNDGYVTANNISMLGGRFIRDGDIKAVRNVAVVSDKLVENMFKPNEDPLGKEIRASVNNSFQTFTIIGVYKHEQNLMFGMSSASSKNIRTDLYIPISTGRVLSSADKGYQNITVMVNPNVDNQEFTIETRNFFNSYYVNNTKFEVGAISMEAMMSEMNTVMGTLSIAISVIAGISLLVGGIGVMNIMLVSVTERTREIGTRKALGAKNSAIRIQFIVEAVIICVIGGLIGVGIGALGGYFGSSLLGFPGFPTYSIVIIAVLFSMSVGVFFGYYPANKAAKLDPIEALRYE